MSFEHDLKSAMLEVDLHIESINLQPGIYHRFRSKGSCKHNCCSYRIFNDYLGAHFKCFRRDIDRIWFSKDKNKMTYEEKRNSNSERQRIFELQDRQFVMQGIRCEMFFENIGMMSEHPSHIKNHPYVQRKCIEPFSAQIARKLLVIPVRNIDYKIQSLQFINPNGFKKFKSGAKFKRGMVWLCDRLPDGYNGIIRICEGWSTGCTIREITRSPVICALSSSNLLSVAVSIRQKYPACIIKICGDNDQWGDKNIGIESAREVGPCVRAKLYYPRFRNFTIIKRPTDFNDLMISEGLAETKRQLKFSTENNDLSILK